MNEVYILRSQHAFLLWVDCAFTEGAHFHAHTSSDVSLLL